MCLCVCVCVCENVMAILHLCKSAQRPRQNSYDSLPKNDYYATSKREGLTRWDILTEKRDLVMGKDSFVETQMLFSRQVVHPTALLSLKILNVFNFKASHNNKLISDNARTYCRFLSTVLTLNRQRTSCLSTSQINI